jgi:serine/threonine-protein kinase
MKRSGPLYTLLAGLLLAAFMLSLNATTGTKSSGYGSGGAASSPPTPPPPPASATPTDPAEPPPPPTPPPAPATTAPPSAPAAENVYAGRTTDDTAAVSISVRNGKAVAYYCDGRTRESWLKGDVKDDGSMRLTGKNGAELEATTRAGKVQGAVEIGDRKQDFTAAKANKPSGLYRATNEVRGTQVDGGWIVLQDGRQVGIVTRGGKPSAAPELDPATGAVVIDNARLIARPVAP